jgi:hypothetical protein
LQIEDECAQIEDRAVGIEVDDEVDIASRHRVAPRYRAEHTDVARAVALRDSLDLRAALTELIEGHGQHFPGGSTEEGVDA